jgi:hypothetical protein
MMIEVMVIMMLMLLVIAGDGTSACAEDAIEPEVSVN